MTRKTFTDLNGRKGKVGTMVKVQPWMEAQKVVAITAYRNSSLLHFEDGTDYPGTMTRIQ